LSVGIFISDNVKNPRLVSGGFVGAIPPFKG